LHRQVSPIIYVDFSEHQLPEKITNKILNGDCLDKLKDIPDNSIDFTFTDPPYNLKKKYSGYSDDLDIQDYFNWCDQWIFQLARVLKPGRTVALLNIPLWAVRHFLYMQTILQYQNWVVWDALAFPVRLIMPAHYTILCFTKGESRSLPLFTGESNHIALPSSPKTFNAFEPLADDFCLREHCVDTRIAAKINDKTKLTDIWCDIHRLKHNSRRVDHPTQLPPHLMYRIISIFTKPNEIVLDCFNGSGTTTLTAHQLGRRYLGIEASEKYWKLSLERHQEVFDGLDPFRKMDRVLTSKNSPVPRLIKQIYKIPKKTLQLEVRRVAQELGHIPSRDELIQYGKYSIEYYDEYFVSWGEVTAAARTTGMTEKRTGKRSQDVLPQMRLLEGKPKSRN
jgi:site-specific DNA-methyltransferase (adenine-specific)